MVVKKNLMVIWMNLLFAACSLAAEKPNILWLFAEDTSPWMGCYGNEPNKEATPNIDALATSGVRFSRAFVSAPVCSSSRSGMMLGANAIRFGVHEHRSGRSGRGNDGNHLPEGIKLLPELLGEQGYFTFNIGKGDYNFSRDDKEIYALSSKDTIGKPWRKCPEGQPFFGQVQMRGGKLKEKAYSTYPGFKPVDPSLVNIPSEYPQNQIYRGLVAEHLNSIRGDDLNLGTLLEELEADGLLDSTIVVYFSDHGANNLVRHKQMATEGGLHVPFIIKGPEKWVPAPGTVRQDLISTLDLTATTLAWGGAPVPEHCEGRNLFADDFKPRSFVASARDRCDYTIDRVRSIRTDRFRYTRNYMLDRVLLQPQYRDPQGYVIDLRKAYAEGSLEPKLVEIYFGERPGEELYDVERDPSQLDNLVNDPSYTRILNEHRELLDTWLAKGDQGIGSEPDHELKRFVGPSGSGPNGKGVNVEYEQLREDTDGDGLSDEWEVLNHRDPEDGLLLFTFDCGGWQTEGWKAEEDVGNIAGCQGFLDFDLFSGQATLVRDGLKLDAEKNKGNLILRMCSSDKTQVLFSANGKVVAQAVVAGGNSFSEYRIPLNGNAWSGTLTDLKINFSAEASTSIEIDWIRVESAAIPEIELGKIFSAGKK